MSKTWEAMGLAARGDWVIEYLLPGWISFSVEEASSDYEVLKHVREMWRPLVGDGKFFMFCEHLDGLQNSRLDSCEGLEKAVSMYEPGDYSHAAYLTLKATDV